LWLFDEVDRLRIKERRDAEPIRGIDVDCYEGTWEGVAGERGTVVCVWIDSDDLVRRVVWEGVPRPNRGVIRDFQNLPWWARTINWLARVEPPMLGELSLLELWDFGVPVEPFVPL